MKILNRKALYVIDAETLNTGDGALNGMLETIDESLKLGVLRLRMAASNAGVMIGKITVRKV